MDCNNVIYKFFAKLSIVALALLAVISCTEVDDELGLNFLPDDQEMTLLVADFPGIKCYLTQDSLPSSNIGVTFFGIAQTASFGITEASPALQYLPGGFKDATVGFGFLPTVDSMAIYLALTSMTGNKVVGGQEFQIFAINKKLYRDSTYYTQFDASKYYDQSKPLFEFKYTDTTSTYVKLTSSPAGLEYLDKLIKTSTDIYKTDTLFHKEFMGLYIAVKNKVNADQQIFSAGLEDSHLIMYYHNHDKDKVINNQPSSDPSVLNDNKDTVKMAYYFDDGTYSYNTSINSLKHDYAQAQFDQSIINDTLSSDQTVDKGYIQTLGGVSTFIRFDEDFVNKILETKKQEEVDFKHMVINKAEIRFYLSSVGTPSIEAMNAAPKRLGMYYNYSKLKTIPDYAYQYEQQGSTLPYGGYLSRSLGYYSMDITSYIQQLMINPKTTPQGINLAPDVSLTYTFGEVVIAAPADIDPKSIKVKLTYTLVK